jgi:hypothetical protein
MTLAELAGPDRGAREEQRRRNAAVVALARQLDAGLRTRL